MNDLLFAPPWWLPVCIIGIGVVLFISGNKRQNRAILRSGIAAFCLALLLVVLNVLVQTDKEKVTKHMKELVADVESRSWDKMKPLLSDKVSLGAINGSIYPNRDELLAGAAHSVDQYQLSSVTITSMDVQQTQTLITVNMNVLTVQEATMGRPVPSGWQFEWERTDKDWALTRITCVSVGDEDVNQLRGLFPK